ncbi:uncharacterized protein CDAR_76771 [Caerostris darwini]|uniref:Uncharacterized protein n=1 Tax=Caerostris darwini TaxID=1538125 RepID=A0AAV4QC19_9ARAC|nr:uncharacterized protein CDAR_76771 [Caerostris darwini]
MPNLPRYYVVVSGPLLKFLMGDKRRQIGNPPPEWKDERCGRPFAFVPGGCRFRAITVITDEHGCVTLGDAPFVPSPTHGAALPPAPLLTPSGEREAGGGNGKRGREIERKKNKEGNSPAELGKTKL